MDEERRVDSRAMELRLAWGSRQRRPEVDESVTEDSKPDPTLHAGVTLVAAAREPMAPLEQTDSPFAAGSPFLGLFEPAFLLFPLPLKALRRPVRH
jgi:hypothetical protein